MVSKGRAAQGNQSKKTRTTRTAAALRKVGTEGLQQE
jgi:hypothetical protein